MGRTSLRCLCLTLSPDHPHAGGENLETISHPSQCNGPSPRGWGERLIPRCHCVWLRTIPTRVGRTSQPTGLPRQTPDHPHAGGENVFTICRHSGIAGPSPRGWGEHVPTTPSHKVRRTIPTRVGRTLTHTPPWPKTPDHPHAGGENAVAKVFFQSLSGPSPRGWGERSCGGFRFRTQRTIPTRVGRTELRWMMTSRNSDHPHAGGENTSDRTDSRNESGPSPRGWGERSGETCCCSDLRTIPTRVGRTICLGECPGGNPDHPHAGGENSTLRHCWAFISGPSPRGWGEQSATALATAETRTIPTRVGRTPPT